MCSYRGALGVAVGAAALLLLSAPANADLTKCATLIEKKGAKMAGIVTKHISKCKDTYHKKPADPKTAKTCETELAKISVEIDKEVTKLKAAFPGTCEDADLITLGHLPHVLFADDWAYFQAVAALDGALQAELNQSGDVMNVLIAMSRTGSCPSCKKLMAPLCNNTTCKCSGAFARVQLSSGALIDAPLVGSVVLRVCDNTNQGLVPGGVLAGIPAGKYFVVGGSGKTLEPARVLPLTTACIRVIRAEGEILCGANPQQVNYSICTDHQPGSANPIGSTTSGNCPGSTAPGLPTGVCASSVHNKVPEVEVMDPDEPDTSLIGGVCLSLPGSPISGPPGSAFVNLTSQIALGPHGDIPNDCTDPSTLETFGTPQISLLTTGQATAHIINANLAGTPIDAELFDGMPYECTPLKWGRTPNASLVGALSTVNFFRVGESYVDSTIVFRLTCEP